MPKKKNPYIIFCLETQQRNPELRGKGLPELVVLCNEEWSGMNMDQRAPYIETAKQLDDNPRYQPSFQSRTTIEKVKQSNLNQSTSSIKQNSTVVKTVKSIYKYSCKLCNSAFTLQSSLNRHTKNIHKTINDL